jgi:hypothetical protein
MRLTKHQVSVKRSLDLLCSGGQKVTSELKQSWNIALRDCTPEHINQATDTVLMDKETDYLIKPGKFREICIQIKRAEKAKLEAQQNPHTNPYIGNKEISKKEAIRIQAAIKKGLPVFNKIPCKKLDLMEYLNSDGDIVKIVCYGHVDLEEFQDNCANQFFAKISNCFHGFHREEKRTTKAGSEFTTMVQCASNQGGSPVTIGVAG